MKGQQNRFHSIHIHFLLHSLFYNYWHARGEQRFSRSPEVENNCCRGTELWNWGSKARPFSDSEEKAAGLVGGGSTAACALACGGLGML